MQIIITLKDFQTWFKTAVKGARFIYHRGWHLGSEGETSFELKKAALFMSDNGYVHLFQRRTPTGFEYIAERRA